MRRTKRSSVGRQIRPRRPGSGKSISHLYEEREKRDVDALTYAVSSFIRCAEALVQELGRFRMPNWSGPEEPRNMARAFIDPISNGC